MKVLKKIMKLLLRNKYHKACTEEKEQILLETIDYNTRIMQILKERLIELYGHTSTTRRR